MHTVSHVLVDDCFKNDHISCLHICPIGALDETSWNEIVAGLLVALCDKYSLLIIHHDRDFRDLDAAIDLEVKFDLLGVLLVLCANDPDVRFREIDHGHCCSDVAVNVAISGTTWFLIVDTFTKYLEISQIRFITSYIASTIGTH